MFNVSFMGWTADDDSRPWSNWATGSDSGPWTRWIPDVWHAAADPAGTHPVPSPPLALRCAPDLLVGAGVSEAQQHAGIIAWWSPLLHLTQFGLGWQDIGVGLTRWVDLGRPTKDPVLKVIERWWGRSVLDLAAWSAPDERGHDLLAEELRKRRSSPDWQRVWGGGSDSMHLTAHVTPLHHHAEEQAVFFLPDSKTTAGVISAGEGRRVLVSESYAGWYRKLDGYASKLENGSTTRVDVFCRSIGWLGQYRKSRRTGSWFRGRHRWHELGAV